MGVRGPGPGSSKSPNIDVSPSHELPVALVLPNAPPLARCLLTNSRRKPLPPNSSQ
jgi:hypothetical protein